MAERKKMLIGNSSEEMLFRETETGEDKILRIDELYEQYKELAAGEDKVIFGGRLGEYKYYDMDQVIASALDASEKILAQ